MQFSDYSPPHSPTIAQQQDALSKGLGRAFQWSAGGKLEDRLILEACISDLRFDRQCESGRGNWLWTLIEAAEAMDRLRGPILHELIEIVEESAIDQLCAIAGHYAERGDQSFYSILYKVVEEKPNLECPWYGEEEIIRLDGQKAFQFAVRIRGERLDEIDWDWDASALVDDAIELFSKATVEGLLISATDQGTKRFYERWQEELNRIANRSQTASRREQMQSMVVRDVINAANSEDRCTWFRGWGMHTQADNLSEVLSLLEKERNTQVIAKLLRVFSNREVPSVRPFLIEYCQSTDRDLRRAALVALSFTSHPLIRAFAISQIASGVGAGDVVRLFTKNFETGDEAKIFEAIVLPDDQNELHWLFMDVLKVLEENVLAEPTNLGLAGYWLTPCDCCRSYFARLLQRRNAVPDWLKRESVHDSNEDCRTLFAEPAV